MAAGSSTTTVKEYSNGVKIVTVVFTTATDDTTLTATTVRGVSGKKLHSILVLGGTTGPTANGDLELNDSVTGVNYVATNGADVVDGNDSVNYLAPDAAYDPCIIWGDLEVDPQGSGGETNIVANATTTVKLLFQDDF